MGLAGFGWTAGFTEASTGARPTRARDFADFIISQDLVFAGTVVDTRQADRMLSGPCGISYPGAVRATDVTIAVDSVWHGVSEDTSVVTVSIAAPRQFGGAALATGDRVLAWATRICDDNWRLWGDVCKLTPDGGIVGPDGAQGSVVTMDLARGGRLTEAHLDSVLTSRAVRDAVTAYEGQAAVALGRLVGSSMVGSTITFECQGLDWMIGSASSYPRYVDFPAFPGCLPGMFQGDSLLIPVPAGYAGGRITLRECPSALRIKNGYAPGLGVPLLFLSHAVESNGGSLHVRRYVSRRH
jgi:hypothetical protein